MHVTNETCSMEWWIHEIPLKVVVLNGQLPNCGLLISHTDTSDLLWRRWLMLVSAVILWIALTQPNKNLGPTQIVDVTVMLLGYRGSNRVGMFWLRSINIHLHRVYKHLKINIQHCVGSVPSHSWFSDDNDDFAFIDYVSIVPDT